MAGVVPADIWQVVVADEGKKSEEATLLKMADMTNTGYPQRNFQKKEFFVYLIM